MILISLFTKLTKLFNIILIFKKLGFLEYSFKYLTFEDSEYIKSLNVMQLKQIQLQVCI